MEIVESTVYVIVVTFNGIQWYDRCFSSIQNSDYPVNIVVVDNASESSCVDYLSSHFPDITIIKSTKNLGFGQANNLGIRYALDKGCDYVFLLNQDVWIETSVIRKLIEIHQNNPQYGILSPVHLTPEMDNIEKGLLTYLDDFRTTDRALFEDLYFSRTKDVYETTYINAAAWLLPRKSLETVGGFDPIFFHYGEDDNYMRRVIYHGMKLGICPKATIVHDCDNKGVRVHSPEEIERRRQLPLLIRFTDITKDESISHYIQYLFKKVISSLLRGNMSLAKKNWNDILYLKHYRHAISISRIQNKKYGKNWL